MCWSWNVPLNYRRCLCAREGQSDKVCFRKLQLSFISQRSEVRTSSNSMQREKEINNRKRDNGRILEATIICVSDMKTVWVVLCRRVIFAGYTRIYTTLYVTFVLFLHVTWHKILSIFLFSFLLRSNLEQLNKIFFLFMPCVLIENILVHENNHSLYTFRRDSAITNNPVYKNNYNRIIVAEIKQLKK